MREKAHTHKRTYNESIESFFSLISKPTTHKQKHSIHMNSIFMRAISPIMCFDHIRNLDSLREQSNECVMALVLFFFCFFIFVIISAFCVALSFRMSQLRSRRLADRSFFLHFLKWSPQHRKMVCCAFLACVWHFLCLSSLLLCLVSVRAPRSKNN